MSSASHVNVSCRRSRIRPLQAARMIIRPAQRSITQLLAAIGIAVTLPLVPTGFVGEPVRDPNRIRYMIAVLQLETLDKPLHRYRADCRRYPDAGEGLTALVLSNNTTGWRGPYLAKLPRDPWGRSFVYESFGNPPRILSYGADGVPGGEFFDSDLSNASLIRSIPESPYEVRANRIRIGLWFTASLVFAGSLYGLVRASRSLHPCPSLDPRAASCARG